MKESRLWGLTLNTFNLNPSSPDATWGNNYRKGQDFAQEIIIDVFQLQTNEQFMCQRL